MAKKDIASAVLAEEKRTIEFYRYLFEEGVDPELGVLLGRLVDLRIQYCKELEEFRRGHDATAEITKQINDMFL